MHYGWDSTIEQQNGSCIIIDFNPPYLLAHRLVSNRKYAFAALFLRIAAGPQTFGGSQIGRRFASSIIQWSTAGRSGSALPSQSAVVRPTVMAGCFLAMHASRSLIRRPAEARVAISLLTAVQLAEVGEFMCANGDGWRANLENFLNRLSSELRLLSETLTRQYFNQAVASRQLSVP